MLFDRRQVIERVAPASPLRHLTRGHATLITHNGPSARVGVLLLNVGAASCHFFNTMPSRAAVPAHVVIHVVHMWSYAAIAAARLEGAPLAQSCTRRLRRFTTARRRHSPWKFTLLPVAYTLQSHLARCSVLALPIAPSGEPRHLGTAAAFLQPCLDR